MCYNVLSFNMTGKLGCEVILFLLILTTCGKLHALCIKSTCLWYNFFTCIENSTNGTLLVNISHAQDACLLQDVTFNCNLPSEATHIQWTVYPLNVTINSTETSDATNNRTISEALYTVQQIQQAVYLLVTANSTPVCNISVSFDNLLAEFNLYSKSTLLWIIFANKLLVFHIAKVEGQQLPHNLASIPTIKELSTDSANTQQNIGECVTEITYGNCSTLGAANFTWYLNESRVDYEAQNNSIYDYQEDSGTLGILNDKAAGNYTGLYRCVTTFPGGLGSYITAATNLVLLQSPITGITTVTASVHIKFICCIYNRNK